MPFTSAINGISFHQDTVRRLRRGDRLMAVAVENNPHDDNAIEVRTVHRGELCGYIPAAVAPRLRANGGHAWECVITDILGRETIGIRMKVLGPCTPPPPPTPLRDAPEETDDNPFQLGDLLRSNSGRVLGTFERLLEGGICLVCEANGLHSTYPISVIASSSN